MVVTGSHNLGKFAVVANDELVVAFRGAGDKDKLFYDAFKRHYRKMLASQRTETIPDIG